VAAPRFDKRPASERAIRSLLFSLRAHWLSCREAYARGADLHFSNLQGFGRKSRWTQCVRKLISRSAEKEKGE